MKKVIVWVVVLYCIWWIYQLQQMQTQYEKYWDEVTRSN